MKTNVAFKCNYNDGGKDETHFGYAGICSDEIKHYNIEKKKRFWCSSEQCPCFQYLYNGYAIDKDEMTCYESKMLIEWKGYAGYNHFGEENGEARAIRNAEAGKIAFFTTVLPNHREEDRLIFGAYRILNPVEYNKDVGGYLPSDPNYRIELTPNEKLYFWHYYFNEKNPSRMFWGTPLYRYLSDNATILILNDLITLKKGTKDESKAKNLLERYCNDFKLDPDKVKTEFGPRR